MSSRTPTQTEPELRPRPNGLEAEISALRNELHDRILVAGELERELAQIKASERWRLGGIVAIPASAVKRFFTR